jgi:ATP-dependent DNA helicase RecG
MHREDIPEYPRVALREALVNAVAHTDYTLRGMQIMVAVYSDRLEIQNPGMLAFGMTLDDLRAGVSRIRNPVIARVFRELGLMEKWGSGYKRIAEDCVAGGYPLPEWVELGPALRVVFRPHEDVPLNVPLNERQSWFLQVLKAGEKLRTKDIAARFGVATKTAKRDVASLREQGLVEFAGASRNGYYKLSHEE